MESTTNYDNIKDASEKRGVFVDCFGNVYDFGKNQFNGLPGMFFRTSKYDRFSGRKYDNCFVFKSFDFKTQKPQGELSFLANDIVYSSNRDTEMSFMFSNDGKTLLNFKTDCSSKEGNSVVKANVKINNNNNIQHQKEMELADFDFLYNKQFNKDKNEFEMVPSATILNSCSNLRALNGVGFDTIICQFIHNNCLYVLGCAHDSRDLSLIKFEHNGQAFAIQPTKNLILDENNSCFDSYFPVAIHNRASSNTLLPDDVIVLSETRTTSSGNYSVGLTSIDPTYLGIVSKQKGVHNDWQTELLKSCVKQEIASRLIDGYELIEDNPTNQTSTVNNQCAKVQIDNKNVGQKK